MAGIYDYINRFWTEAERSPFNPTEVALYHYLLYEANRLRWNMPFACHTAILCVRLSTTKQNISKARQHLKERGLIDCQVGTGIHTPQGTAASQRTWADRLSGWYRNPHPCAIFLDHTAVPAVAASDYPTVDP